MGDNEMKVIISASGEGLKSGLDQAGAQVKAACNQMLGHFNSMESSIGSISSVITSHLGAIATGLSAALVVSFVRSSVEAFESYAGSVRQLSNTLGITAEAASALGASLQIAGISNEAYIGTAMRMERQIRSDEDKFKSMGIAVRDAAGAYRPITAVLGDVVEKMKTYRAGQDQMLFAMDAFGPRGAEMAFKLKKLAEAEELAIPLMKELGLEMGEKGKKAAHEYEMQVNALSYVWDALKIKIGAELIPTLTDLMKILVQISVPIVNALVAGFKGIITVCIAVGGAAQVMGSAVLGVLFSISSILSGIVRAAVLAFKGDWSGAWAALKGGAQQAVLDLKVGGNAMVGVAADTYEQIKKLWTKSPMQGGEKQSGTASYTPYKKPEAGKYESRIGEWKAELVQMETDEKAYYGLGADRERAFWEEKLRLTTTAGKNETKERNDVLREIFNATSKAYKDDIATQLEWLKSEESNERLSWELRKTAARTALEIVKQNYGAESKEAQKAQEALQKLSEQEINQQKEIQSKVLDTQVKTADEAMRTRTKDAQHRVEMGIITERTAIALERQYEEERWAIEQSALEKQIELWQEYPVKYQEMLEKMREAKSRHDETLRETDRKLQLEQKKIFDQLLSPIQSAVSTSIKGIIQGTTTLKEAMRNLGQSILLSFVDVFSQLAMKWLATQLWMLITGKAMEVTRAVESITASAALGAAGAFAQAAAAYPPPIGEAIGAAAAGSVYAATLSWIPAATAAQGWDVDREALTMLHPQEMVLPATLAEGVRDVVAGGGSAGRQTLVVQALDSADVKRWARKNPGPIRNAMERSYRELQFTSMRRH